MARYNCYGSKYIHDAFVWVKDVQFTNNAHEEAKKRGKDFPYKFVFLKPTFSLLKYLKLVFLPVFIGWLLLSIISIFVWPYRRVFLDRIAKKMDAIDSLLKFIIALGITLSCFIMHILGFSLEAILAILCFILLIVPISWFLFKRALYEIVYLITKAIEDAKK